MKNYFFFLLAYACLLLFTSCQESIYNKIETIPAGAWKKEVPIIFKADIQDISKPVSLTLLLRHHANTLYGHVNFSVTMTLPSGKKTPNFYTLEIRDKASGELKGDAAGDYCDTEMVLNPNLALTEKGVYTFAVSQEMEEPVLPLMMDLGLTISQNKK
jgi:gliding motility-associated lipoprotein GldH